MISVVTDPFSESFDPLVSALFLGGFAVNVGLFLASLFLIYGYFKRKVWFPTVFVSVLLLSIVYLVADALAVGYAFPNEPVWDTATTKDLSRQIGSAIVWVPYMFLSRRVKNTFVY